MRRSAGLTLLSFVAFFWCPQSILAQDCFDYREFLSIVGTVATPGDARRIVLAGSYAYVADREHGLQVVDVADVTQPVIVGSLVTADVAIDVAIAGSFAYLIFLDTGLHVVDISNPSNPLLVGSVDPPGQEKSVVVSGNYAFIAAESAGLMVVDISNPAAPKTGSPTNSQGSAISPA